MVHPIWDTMPEIQQELVGVKQLIKSELQLRVPEVAAKIQDYIDAPGKYLRAGLCLVLASYTPEGITQQKRYSAAALEVLHLATLIHDDVIDGATTRRGIVSMHAELSNRTAIYAGDYLITYALRLMAKGQMKLETGGIDAWVMEGILVGELNQLANQFRHGMTIYDYLRQIRGKTALLFAAATFFGYYSLNQSAWQNKQAFYAGQAIGMAFQLTDDLIDYQVDSAHSGKPRMQDVQNGIYTAPLILAMQDDSAIRQQLKPKGEVWQEAELTQLYQALAQLNSFERTGQLADNYLKKAIQRLNKLAKRDQTQPLVHLLEIMMQRKF